MKLFFEIKFDIYPATVIVSIGQTDDEVYKRLSKPFREKEIWRLGDAPEEIEAFTCPLQDGYIFLRFRWPPEDPKKIAVYAHEIFHAAHYIMDWITHPIGNWKSGEPVAYVISHITRRIWEEAEKANKKAANVPL